MFSVGAGLIGRENEPLKAKSLTNRVLKVGLQNAGDVISRSSVESQNFVGRNIFRNEFSSFGLKGILQNFVVNKLDAGDLVLKCSSHVLEKNR